MTATIFSILRIPILVFWISGLLAPVSEGPEKLSSYESGIEPMGGLGYNSEYAITCLR